MSGLIPRIMSGLCPTNPGDKYPQDHHEAEEQGDGCDWDLPMQDLRWGHPDFEQFPEFPDPQSDQHNATQCDNDDHNPPPPRLHFVLALRPDRPIEDSTPVWRVARYAFRAKSRARTSRTAAPIFGIYG